MRRVQASLIFVLAGCGTTGAELTPQGLSDFDLRVMEDVRARFASSDAAGLVDVASAAPRWESNEWGDQLIITRSGLHLAEALRGSLPEAFEVESVGGTIGEITLVAGHHAQLRLGERAIVFVGKDLGSGQRDLALADRSVLPVQVGDVVTGTGLTLDMIRALAREVR